MKDPVWGDGSLLKSDIVMAVQLGKFTQNHEIVYLRWVNLWYVNHFSIKVFPNKEKPNRNKGTQFIWKYENEMRGRDLKTEDFSENIFQVDIFKKKKSFEAIPDYVRKVKYFLWTQGKWLFLFLKYSNISISIISFNDRAYFSH